MYVCVEVVSECVCVCVEVACVYMYVWWVLGQGGMCVHVCVVGTGTRVCEKTHKCIVYQLSRASLVTKSFVPLVTTCVLFVFSPIG